MMWRQPNEFDRPARDVQRQPVRARASADHRAAALSESVREHSVGFFTPSSGTPGEGWGGGCVELALLATSPHPNPPPEYRRREQESARNPSGALFGWHGLATACPWRRTIGGRCPPYEDTSARRAGTARRRRGRRG